ncbi:MAG: bacterial Ig-like domain-containing protein [Clostridia bacterium]
MISGYNKTQVGAQTVTITYTDNENNVHTQTFGVRVEDSIKTITLENNNFKTNYKYGENLDLSGLTLKVTKESGEISTVAVTTGMISGYNPNKLGSQTLTINYEGKQFTIVVNVVDYVTDIILTPPTKDEYKIGESLSLVGGSITEKMASGANGSTISLTNSMVSGFDSTTPGTKNLTVTYVKDGKTYTKTFQVAVINTINHIEVIAPTKTDYKYGENLNLSGGSVKIYMEDGTIKTVPLTSQMVTGYSKTTPGQQMLKVTYTSDDDKKYEGYFKVTVGEDYIKDTKFVAPTKKEYRIGDTIDLTGGSITEVYASEKLGNKYDLTNSMISGFDSTTPGTKQITVTFNNKTYQYSVTVKDRTLGISIKTLPNKLEYKKGENLDLTGATLNVVKESGTQVIKITADGIRI